MFIVPLKGRIEAFKHRYTDRENRSYLKTVRCVCVTMFVDMLVSEKNNSDFLSFFFFLECVRRHNENINNDDLNMVQRKENNK